MTAQHTVSLLTTTPARISFGAGFAWKTAVSDSEMVDKSRWWSPNESLNGWTAVAGFAATSFTPRPLRLNTFLFTGFALNWWLKVNTA